MRGGSAFVLSCVCLVLAVPATGATVVLPSTSEAPASEGLSPGDSFTVNLRYWNYWAEGAVINPASSSNSPGASAPASIDPLDLAMRIQGQVREDGSVALTFDMQRVSYHDGRGTSWTFRPNPRRDAAAWAKRLTDKLAPRLESDKLGRVEREAIEEQLLGIALSRAHGLTVTVEVEPSGEFFFGGDASEQLETRLPEGFPPELRDQAEMFLEKAIARFMAPRPESLRPRTKFEHRGLSYRVDHVGTLQGKPTVGVLCHVRQRLNGQNLRDAATFMPAIGLVLKSSFEDRQERYLGQGLIRLSIEQWTARLAAFERTPASPAAKAAAEESPAQ